jgi:EAL domain-containing protein (putative c-di-GMP-specific phosphodiesterase class I)
VAESTAHRLAGGTVEMHMQPIVDLETHTTVAFEALARLVRPDGTLVNAAEFVPRLSPLDIDRLFVIALDQSLRALASWRGTGLDVDVSVNIDPSTLASPDCADWIADALRTHAVPPVRLLLEILETHAITDPRQRSTIAAIGSIGARLVLDDLGSGHSDLERLESIDFDMIKIDGAVVAALASAPEETIRTLVDFVRIGTETGLRTVVEGIETLEMAAVASIVGAQLGQGYEIARPMPASEVLGWVAGQVLSPSGYEPSFSSVLAFHGRYGSGSPHTGDVDDCWISAFLAAHAGSEPVGEWHASQHGAATAQTADGGRRLTDWLVRCMDLAA